MRQSNEYRVPGQRRNRIRRPRHGRCRQALGDDQISYLGFSYGTELGTAYLEEFGDHVRTMVLDGAIDPTVGPNSGKHQPNGWIPNGFQRLRPRTVPARRAAAGHRPGPVRQPVPRPGRPVGHHAARHRIHAAWATPTRPPHLNALYTPQHWKYLTSGLLGLQRRTDAGDLLMLADDYDGRDKDGHYSNDQDAFNAIRCVDAPAPKDAAAWVSADQQIVRPLRFKSYGQFTGTPADLCALWPVPATSTPHAAAPAAAGRSSWSPPPRPGHPVSGRGGLGPSTGCSADHLRRNPAHRGVQRDECVGHRCGALLRRGDVAAGVIAVPRLGGRKAALTNL